MRGVLAPIRGSVLGPNHEGRAACYQSHMRECGRLSYIAHAGGDAIFAPLLGLCQGDVLGPWGARPLRFHATPLQKQQPGRGVGKDMGSTYLIQFLELLRKGYRVRAKSAAAKEAIKAAKAKVRAELAAARKVKELKKAGQSVSTHAE